MLLIWGSKGREVTEKSGSFNCPNCRCSARYEQKKAGQYFTLFFIPLFQTRLLGRYVECAKCQTKFKEEVLRQTPVLEEVPRRTGRIEPTLDDHSEQPETSHEPINPYEVMDMHMTVVQAQLAETLEPGEFDRLTPEQHSRFLAFELGVIEYFAHQIVEVDMSKGDAAFGNFVLGYANYKYSSNSEEAFSIWWSFATEGARFRERELGFESCAKQYGQDGTARRGHYHARYLRDALYV